MSYTYWLHEKIQEDFDEAYEWYEHKKKGLGREFLDAVEAKITDIITHPTSYSSKGNPNFREARLDRFPFVIVYRIYEKKKEIFISAVHHSKKTPGKKYRK